MLPSESYSFVQDMEEREEKGKGWLYRELKAPYNI